MDARSNVGMLLVCHLVYVAAPPRILPDAVQESLYAVRYKAEGAANIIFTLTKCDAPTDQTCSYFAVRYMSHGDEIVSIPNEPLESYCLRVPKASTHILPPAHFENTMFFIKDYIRRDLIAAHYCVSVVPGFATSLNGHLARLGSARPERWRNHTVHEYMYYAYLIQDMSRLAGVSADPQLQPILLEIKPKWLLQSPEAQGLEMVERCRTCATRALRNQNRGPADKEQAEFCPLWLVSQNREEVGKIVRMLLEKNDGWKALEEPARTEIHSEITKSLTQGEGFECLSSLRRAQARFAPSRLDAQHVLGRFWDPVNMMDMSSLSKVIDFDECMDRLDLSGLAMTLRDCSMFIQVHPSRPTSVVVKLADLDLKRTSKQPVWRAHERQLLNGGWYVGKEANRQPETICKLAHERARDTAWYM